uniref:Putative lanthionine synthetase c-like protein 1 n=1 Tax=Ornithodoros turicata TaxID=34597 RepID=A0A2R5LDA0_9ACAR
MSDRAFENEFQDYDDTSDVVLPEGKLTHSFQTEVRSNIFKLVEKLDKHLTRGTDWSDSSVYTGTTGIALLYIHLSDVFEDDSYLAKALPYVQKPLSSLRGKRFSFLCGDPGPLATGAYIYHRLGKKEESHKLIKKLVALADEVVPLDSDIPDELLYGRVGYLFSLLYVRKNISHSAVDDGLVRQVMSSVLKSGQQLAKQMKISSPLMYQWHDSYYLGAAHGLAGILYMLLQAKEQLSPSEMQSLIQPSIRYYLGLKYPSGNFPSSLGSQTDKLIHWCHGAPGAIHLFALAHTVFGEDAYLSGARRCADVIWSRGLLKKGYGICHGVSGNGYAFLRMFQHTGNAKYLHRAAKFCEWCFDYGQHNCRTPDRPYSLFEGMAGTIYFMADMLQPEKSAFPAFQLF